MQVQPCTPDLMSSAAAVEEWTLARGYEAIEQVSARQQPVILRGFVEDWPGVHRAKAGDAALVEYLLSFDAGAAVPVSAGPASLKGRMFYNHDFTGLNTDRGTARFSTFMRQVLEQGARDAPPLIYMASVDVDEVVPGFGDANKIDFGTLEPLASIWIGTRHAYRGP